MSHTRSLDDSSNGLAASLRLNDAVANLGRCVIATAEKGVVPMERALRDKTTALLCTSWHNAPARFGAAHLGLLRVCHQLEEVSLCIVPLHFMRILLTI